MPLVDAVEKHTFTIANGSEEPTTAHLALSSFGGGTITNSTNTVPFVSRKATSDTVTFDDWDAASFSAYFSNGTDNTAGTSHIHVSRDVSQTYNDYEIVVTLVKFNATAVLVQSGNWWATGEHNINPSRTDTLGTNVDSAKSFIIHNHKQASGGSYESIGSHAVRAWFPTEGASVNQVTFERGIGGQGTHHINYWVVTSLTGEFTVDHVNLTLGTTETSASGAATQTAGKTALFGSYSSTYNSNTITGPSCVTARLDGTNAVIEREATGGSIDWRGMAVTFTDDTNVYTGSQTITAATEGTLSGGLTGVAIGASVDPGKSYIGPSGTSEHLAGGRGNSTLAEHNLVSAGVNYEFVGDPSTTFDINFFDTSGNYLDRYYEWQVIEWDDGSGAPAPAARRFMVTS